MGMRHSVPGTILKFLISYLQKRKNVLKGAKDDVKGLAKRLKKAKNKLKKYHADLEDVQGVSNVFLIFSVQYYFF